MASEGYHEDGLSPETQDMHRAIVSLKEELEAVDWYRQRADVCADEELRQILLHNMREEIEHATMLLEWLRRRDSTFDTQYRAYLFSKGSIAKAEEKAADSDAGHPAGEKSAPQTTIGSLKEK